MVYSRTEKKMVPVTIYVPVTTTTPPRTIRVSVGATAQANSQTRSGDPTANGAGLVNANVPLPNGGSAVLSAGAAANATTV